MEYECYADIVFKKQKPLVAFKLGGELQYFLIDTTSLFGYIDKTFATSKGLSVLEIEGELFAGCIFSMNNDKVKGIFEVVDMDTSLYVGALGISFLKNNDLVIDIKSRLVYRPVR